VKSTPLSEADAALLQARIYAAVDELKAMGWPIERVIVRIKDVAREVGLPLGNALNSGERDRVLDRAVLWCAERYYEDRS
jgi:hypothetical protein